MNADSAAGGPLLDLLAHLCVQARRADTFARRVAAGRLADTLHRRRRFWG
jgi:hypothetical protein